MSPLCSSRAWGAKMRRQMARPSSLRWRASFLLALTAAGAFGRLAGAQQRQRHLEGALLTIPTDVVVRVDGKGGSAFVLHVPLAEDVLSGEAAYRVEVQATSRDGASYLVRHDFTRNDVIFGGELHVPFGSGSLPPGEYTVAIKILDTFPGLHR